MYLNTRININKLYSSLLLATFCLNTKTEFIYCILVVFLLIWLISGKWRHLKLETAEDYFPIILLIIWIYGIFRGLICGNKTSYIVANFAGLACYIIYYVLLTSNFNVEKLRKILIWSGLVVAFIATFRFVAFFLGINYSFLYPIIGEGMGISSTGQIRIYFTNQAISYTTLGLSFMAVSFSMKSIQYKYFKNKTISVLILLICISSLMFFSASKGFMLGAIIIIFALAISYNLKSTINLKFNIGITKLILLTFILLIMLYQLEYFSILEKVFDSSDSGNATRYEQLPAIIEDCSFWGKGLGATINGCVRSDEAPYGFELTYINVIHKFGILSILIFSLWIFMGIKSLKKIYHREYTSNSIIVFSSLGYLFPSIGNPLLFHPSLVILNSCALYLLKKEYE